MIIETESEGMKSIYGIRRGAVSLKTLAQQSSLVIHRLNVNPDFDNIVHRDKGIIVMENKKDKKILKVRTNAGKIRPVKDELYSGLRFFFDAGDDSSVSFETAAELKEMRNG